MPSQPVCKLVPFRLFIRNSNDFYVRFYSVKKTNRYIVRYAVKSRYNGSTSNKGPPKTNSVALIVTEVFKQVGFNIGNNKNTLITNYYSLEIRQSEN